MATNDELLEKLWDNVRNLCKLYIVEHPNEAPRVLGYFDMRTFKEAREGKDSEFVKRLVTEMQKPEPSLQTLHEVMNNM